MSKPQKFGGAWTEAKLSAVEKYLSAYMTIMRSNPAASTFTTTYLDGFAGSGRRYATQDGAETDLFSDDFRDVETGDFYKGSPARALAIDPPFDRYIFIEPKLDYVEELKNLVAEFPDRKNSVSVLQGDANEIIPKWCAGMLRDHRALVFLDPYGMQVNWETVTAIAATKKIDLWVLVPLGQAIVRLLTTKGHPPKEWADALTRFFGTNEWLEHFYVANETLDLFGEAGAVVRDADFNRITQYIVSRLSSVFEAALDEPLLLRNSNGTPLYLLCFAASNPKGASTAVKIAKHIARSLSNGG
jgi:three-Cys-motif partner protein